MTIKQKLKPLVFVLCLLPFGWLVYRGVAGGLGANPIKAITHFTGDWTLYFLLLTLAITPLRRLTGRNSLIRFRRMLGLYAFFYACLHFATYLVLDQFFDWNEIFRDIAKRPYITVGFSAYVLLFPLAATSTRNMVQRLGKGWKRLHGLIYLLTGLGLLHYLWLVKADIRTPVILILVYITLLVLRLPRIQGGLKQSFMKTSS